MKTQLLTQMIEHASINQRSKRLANLALQIAVDPELGDEVTIDNFDASIYSVGDIRLIRQVINYHII